MNPEWYWTKRSAATPLVLIGMLVLLNAFSQTAFLQCRVKWMVDCEEFDYTHIYSSDKVKPVVGEKTVSNEPDEDKEWHRQIVSARYSGRMVWVFFVGLNAFLFVFAIFFSIKLIQNAPNAWKFGPGGKSMFGGSHLGCKCPLLEPHFSYFLAHSAAMASKMSLMRTPNRPFSLPKHHLQTCSKLWPVLGFSTIAGILMLIFPQSHSFYVIDILKNIIGTKVTGALGVPGIFPVMNVINVLTMITAFFLAYTSCMIISIDQKAVEDALGSSLAEPAKTDERLAEIAKQLSNLRLILYLGTIILIAGILRMNALLNWALSYIPREYVGPAESFHVALISVVGGFFTLILASTYLPAAHILQERATFLIDKLKLPKEKRQEKLLQNHLTFSLRDSLPRVIAILGPVLAGSIRDFLTHFPK